MVRMSGVLALGDSITNGGGELQYGVALQSWALWTARGLGMPYTGLATDGAGDRVVRARHAGEGAAEQRVGLARAVGVGGDDGANPAPGAKQSLQALIGDGLAEVHEAPAAPGAHCRMTEHVFTLRSRPWNSMP